MKTKQRKAKAATVKDTRTLPCQMPKCDGRMSFTESRLHGQRCAECYGRLIAQARRVRSGTASSLSAAEERGLITRGGRWKGVDE